MSQPYFSKRRIRRIIVIVSVLASGLILAAWAAKEVKILHFDWSFTLPVISLIAAFVPIGSATVDWFEKKMSVLDVRLDAIEPAVITLKEFAGNAKSDHEELRRILLRQEASIEYLKATLSKLDLPRVLAENQKLSEKLKAAIQEDEQ